MKEQELAFVSAVIYVNESAHDAGDVLLNMAAFLKDGFEKAEIICVNDAAPMHASDDVEAALATIAADRTSGVQLSVLDLSRPHGFETAMTAGVDLSIGDFVVEMDAASVDYTTEDIMRAFQKCKEGFDVVSGVPDAKGPLTSRLYYAVFNRSAHTDAKLMTEGFRIVSRRAVNRAASSVSIIPYRKAVYASIGLPSAAIVYEPTAGKHITHDRGTRVRTAMDSLILFTQTGYRITIGLAGFMMVVALVIIAYAITMFVTGIAISGWLTTVFFFTICFFGLFCILALMIKYLQMLIDLTYRKRSYTAKGVRRL